MPIRVKTPSQKRAAAIGLWAFAVLYIGVAACLTTADWLASQPELRRLQMAVWLDQTNGEYRHRLGRYFDLVSNDPTSALAAYRKATQLNPHDARYWLDLANTYQLLGDNAAQASAIEHAVKADAKTPDVAWEAANLYLVQGQTEKALQEFRIVMDGAPNMSSIALQLCWRIRPDVDQLLAQVIPPRQDAYLALLSQLMTKEDTPGTVKAWSGLIHLGEPVQMEVVFPYVRYLLYHKATREASLVWRQAASQLGMSAYLPSSNNLIVNGSFSLPILNGGFDWQYHKTPSVGLALDSSESHDGHRSLAITFEGPGIDDAGVGQLIAVQPDTTYTFVGHYKNADMEGAGGPHFVLQDFFTGQIYFESEELKDGAFWKSVVGEFTTGGETTVLLLHVPRTPAGSPIRGKLWIDDFRLTEKSSSGDQS